MTREKYVLQGKICINQSQRKRRINLILINIEQNNGSVSSPGGTVKISLEKFSHKQSFYLIPALQNVP